MFSLIREIKIHEISSNIIEICFFF